MSVAPALRAAPVLLEGVLVVPLGSGLWALDARSGEPRWSKPVTDVVGWTRSATPSSWPRAGPGAGAVGEGREHALGAALRGRGDGPPAGRW
ncbi:hypothetical protein ACLEQD_11060, partial [Corallococcus sp. 4LFB]